MRARRTIPLAWLTLANQQVRFLVAIIGIAAAGSLLYLQLGLRDSLYDTSVKLHEKLNADIVLVNRSSTNLSGLQSFSRRRLAQVYGDSRVVSAEPLLVGQVPWKVEQTDRLRNVTAVGVRPGSHPFLDKEIDEQLSKLKGFSNILFEKKTRKELGPVQKMYQSGESVRTEINGQRLSVDGLISIGANFTSDGFILTNDLTYRQLRQGYPHEGIDIGLIKLEPNSDAEQISMEINKILPKDVELLTKKAFIEREKKYWRENTAIGFIFSLGSIIAIVVGVLIVYQILHADVTDHLAEYATLMAMGYEYSSIARSIANQGLIIGLIGCFPSALVGQVVYKLIASVSVLPIRMTSARIGVVSVSLMVIATISAVTASTKLKAADPAEIF